MNARLVPRCLHRLTLGSSTLALALGAAASSCQPAAGGDPDLSTPVHGAGGAPGSSASGPVATTSGDSASASAAVSGSGSQTVSSTGTGAPPTGMPRLTVDFTTISFNGEYAPRNVGAVWITDGQDGFVKTLEKWAVKRSKYLVKWKAASDGNIVDAVTGATRLEHAAHALTWDGTDVNGSLVADGIYRVYIEFTEEDYAGPWTSIEFTKGPSPVTITPANLADFTGQSVTYTP
jgi:hypothetical protein